MSIFNNPEENYWRNFATKTVLILITVAIIVWFLPRNEGRMFRYDVGKPWMYGSVIAKFDFPIYKTDEAIKREQDSLMKQFQPYYSVNESIGSEQVSRFLHDFSQGRSEEHTSELQSRFDLVCRLLLEKKKLKEKKRKKKIK